MVTANDVLKQIEDMRVRWVDLQFVDLPGALQHLSMPSHKLDLDSFDDGVGKLDGSSIAGFKAISDSDMLLLPAPETFAVIPWEKDTARMFCDIREGYDGPRFTRDSRFITQKAEDAIKNAGYGVAQFGPELEFFVFDSVTFDGNMPARGQGYTIDSREAAWNAYGQNYPIPFKGGYYPAPPQDTLQMLRAQVSEILEDIYGITVEAHHHEVATAGQCEIDMTYAPVGKMADNVVTYKYVVKNIASQNGVIATFMPKPIYGDNASGMHVHQSLWKDEKNAFFDPSDEYAEVSQTCRYYMGGLLSHARALSALCSPTTNSYKRLMPGYEAPVYVAWSKGNRSAAIRIPIYKKGEEASKRIEYRPPDPSCNPYLAFAALVAAGLDGIKKKTDCGDPVDENIYHLDIMKRKELGIRELPGSLDEALEELQSDSAFLKPIFTDDLLETYVELKTGECKHNAMLPTPFEFKTYLNV
ncbi:MAG: type I glutamate--ammonia ligase [Candidatus Micrarchaeota archaeon]